VDAVHATVATLRARFPIASMNALLLSPERLIAVHASEHALIPHEDFDASGMTDEELPRHHRDEYYLMRYRRLDDGTVIFASSGLDIGGWTPLPAESIAVVDLRTLELTIEPIGRAGLAGAPASGSSQRDGASGHDHVPDAGLPADDGPAATLRRDAA
jgi:hypothetical protein